MIKKIIQILSLFDYYDGSDVIQFAKGKCKAPTTVKETRDILKRTKNG